MKAKTVSQLLNLHNTAKKGQKTTMEFHIFERIVENDEIELTFFANLLSYTQSAVRLT